MTKPGQLDSLLCLAEDESSLRSMSQVLEHLVGIAFNRCLHIF